MPTLYRQIWVHPQVYDAETLEEIQTFRYDKLTTTNEGWGITHDGANFLVSDGGSNLHTWNPEDMFAGTMRTMHTTAVKYPDGKPCTLLNELEWIPDGGGVVLANIWFSDLIVAIDPVSGYVLHTYDFKKLHPKRKPNEDVFNGIAFNETDRTLILYGKQWTRSYVVDFPDQSEKLSMVKEAFADAMPPDV